MWEEVGRFSTISPGGGARVSKSDQPISTTANGDRLRFVNLMVIKMLIWLKSGTSTNTTSNADCSSLLLFLFIATSSIFSIVLRKVIFLLTAI